MELLVIVREASGGAVPDHVLPGITEPLHVGSCSLSGSRLPAALATISVLLPLLEQSIMGNVAVIKLLDGSAEAGKFLTDAVQFSLE